MTKTDDYRDPKPTPQFYWQTTRSEPTPAQLHEHARAQAAKNNNAEPADGHQCCVPYPRELFDLLLAAVRPFADASQAVADAIKEYYHRRENPPVAS